MRGGVEAKFSAGGCPFHDHKKKVATAPIDFDERKLGSRKYLGDRAPVIHPPTESRRAQPFKASTGISYCRRGNRPPLNHDTFRVSRVNTFSRQVAEGILC